MRIANHINGNSVFENLKIRIDSIFEPSEIQNDSIFVPSYVKINDSLVPDLILAKGYQDCKFQPGIIQIIQNLLIVAFCKKPKGFR